jgi:hypothetical protein
VVPSNNDAFVVYYQYKYSTKTYSTCTAALFYRLRRQRHIRSTVEIHVHKTVTKRKPARPTAFHFLFFRNLARFHNIQRIWAYTYTGNNDDFGLLLELGVNRIHSR